MNIEYAADTLKKRIGEYLRLCSEEGKEDSMLRGAMTKEFPTTVAIIVSIPGEGGIKSLCLWAGDSRCYMLREDGLYQLSEDDVGDIEAMDNLSKDGVLTNVISASREFVIHSKVVEVEKPCILFSATDGCFGYLSTPREFEYILVSELAKAQSIDDFEKALLCKIDGISGDDFSLVGMAIRYGSFANLTECFKPRAKVLDEQYISKLEKCNEASRNELWMEYRVRYSRYLDYSKMEHSSSLDTDIGDKHEIGETKVENRRVTFTLAPPTDLD